MSRSLSNAVSLSELGQQGYTGKDVRFFLMGIHYRKPIHYSAEALQAAKNSVRKINTFVCRLLAVENSQTSDFAETDQLIYDLKHDFANALDDDLNIAGALAALFSFMGKVNAPLTRGEINKGNADKITTALKNIDEVLGVIDFNKHVAQRGINDLIDKREAARKVRNWEEADSYRAKLSELGVDVLDTPHGVVWRFR
jgi:cysteinyl-tRNA synthetase